MFSGVADPFMTELHKIDLTGPSIIILEQHLHLSLHEKNTCFFIRRNRNSYWLRHHAIHY
jgi:hypothetical protein